MGGLRCSYLPRLWRPCRRSDCLPRATKQRSATGNGRAAPCSPWRQSGVTSKRRAERVNGSETRLLRRRRKPGPPPPVGDQDPFLQTCRCRHPITAPLRRLVTTTPRSELALATQGLRSVAALKGGWGVPPGPLRTAQVLVRALWGPPEPAGSAGTRPSSVADPVARRRAWARTKRYSWTLGHGGARAGLTNLFAEAGSHANSGCPPTRRSEATRARPNVGDN